MGGQFGQAGAHTEGIGWQIGRSQGAALGIPGQAFIGFDGENRAVEDIDKIAV